LESVPENCTQWNENPIKTAQQILDGVALVTFSTN